MTTKSFINRTRWLHSALCALILLFTLGVGNAWGASATLPVNYSFGDGKSSLPTGVTDPGTTLGSDYAAGNSPYRLKFDNNDDYIQIEVDAAAETITIGIKEFGTSGASIQIQGSSNGSSFTNIQTLSFSKGQNKSSSQSTSNSISSSYRYFRVKRNSGSNFGLGTLAITKASSCTSSITITKGDNPANGTFTLTTSGSVCIDEGNASTTVNATPSSHYHLATVTSSGGGNIGSISNNSCTISNISANTTINVTFAADPTYTVTWVAGTNPSFSTQTNYAGTALTDPGTPDGSTVCGSKVFRGWTATPIVGEDDEAPNDLFTSVSGKSIPEGGTTYYAVFATQSGGGSVFDHYEKVTTAPTDWTAHKYVYATADAGYVLTGKASGGNYGAYATMSTTTEMASYEITVENGSTDNYKLKQGGKYISCSSFGNLYWNNSYTAKTSSVNNGDWMFYKPSGTAYRIESPVKNSNNKWIYIDFNSSADPKRFNSYVSGNQTAVYLYKRVETSGYTYSNYATSCGSCSVNPTIGAASLNGSFS